MVELDTVCRAAVV